MSRAGRGRDACACVRGHDRRSPPAHRGGRARPRPRGGVRSRAAGDLPCTLRHYGRFPSPSPTGSAAWLRSSSACGSFSVDASTRRRQPLQPREGRSLAVLRFAWPSRTPDAPLRRRRTRRYALRACGRSGPTASFTAGSSRNSAIRARSATGRATSPDCRRPPARWRRPIASAAGCYGCRCGAGRRRRGAGRNSARDRSAVALDGRLSTARGHCRESGILGARAFQITAKQ